MSKLSKGFIDMEKEQIIMDYLYQEIEKIKSERSGLEKDIITLKKEVSRLLSLENELYNMRYISNLNLQKIDIKTLDFGDKLILHCKGGKQN